MIPISVSAEQTLQVENRIIDFLVEHFNNPKNWVLIPLKKIPTLQYQVPKVLDFMASGKFRDVSSAVFSHIQKAMVRTGVIRIEDEYLTAYSTGGVLLLWQERDLPNSRVYISLNYLNLEGVRVSFFNPLRSVCSNVNDDKNFEVPEDLNSEAFGALYTKAVRS